MLLIFNSNAGTIERAYLPKHTVTKASSYFSAQVASHSNIESNITITHACMTRELVSSLLEWMLSRPTFLRSSCKEQAHQLLAVRLWNVGEACDMPKLHDEAMKYLYESVKEF